MLCGEERLGFTLMEVLVSLLIIATSLLFLLSSIRMGLGKIETVRSQLRSSLLMQTILSTSLYNLEVPLEKNWTSQDFPLVPGWKVIRIYQQKEPDRELWIGQRESLNLSSPKIISKD